jgi:hypothetical protein
MSSSSHGTRRAFLRTAVAAPAVFGAVLDALRPSGRLPSWVQIGPLMRRNNGTVLHGQLPGFLGARRDDSVPLRGRLLGRTPVGVCLPLEIVRASLSFRPGGRPWCV